MPAWSPGVCTVLRSSVMVLRSTAGSSGASRRLCKNACRLESYRSTSEARALSAPCWSLRASTRPTRVGSGTFFTCRSPA